MRARLTASGHWLWSAERSRVAVRFVGRGPAGDRHAAARVAGAPRQIAWARQLHSTRVLTAAPGRCGDGDALLGDRRGLALTVATADCVPLLLGGDAEIAAVHAGWRGIAAGIVGETLDRLHAPAAELSAWTGPSIGACCYEVGEEVASRVAAASDDGIVVASGGGRPHLDLAAAVEAQLRRRGLTRIHRVSACTRCDAARLWSYRRQGTGAGRNLAFIWLRADRARS